VIEINILGPLELRDGDRAWIPRGPKVRKLLAALALRPGEVIDIATLAEELWEDSPPATLTATIRSHVYHLRLMLAGESGLPRAADLISTEPTGYRLRAAADQIDAVRFERIVIHGRTLLERGEPAESAAVLRQALSLWRGPALVDIACGRVLDGHVTRLAEGRLRATELRLEADLRLGRHRDLVPELRGLVAAHPLNESLHAQLIETLRRSGRRAEALTAFTDLRRTLASELGVEPSPELRILHQTILANEPAYAGAWPQGVAS
jgi:SARP family transcriptional regulator, regulator of embCAB operon